MREQFLIDLKNKSSAQQLIQDDDKYYIIIGKIYDQNSYYDS